MNSKAIMGRPEVHGLDVIKGDRVRRARSALCLGQTRTQISREIFDVSPKTFKRYMDKDDPRSRRLKRAVEEGEALRAEPLGELICYLLDMRENALAQRSKLIYQLPNDESDVDLSALEISEEDAELDLKLSQEIKAYTERLEQAFKDNAELRAHRKTALSPRAIKRIKGLSALQEGLLESDSILTSM